MNLITKEKKEAKIKEILFKEVSEMIRFYQEADILDFADLDYRIKSEDSCIRKYNKFYPDMQLEKVFNDILGFRMLTDSYKNLLEGEIPEEVRVVDMSYGKANDDGYRGVHIYFQPVGRIPVVLFLKYDPKDIIITLGGLIWGPMTSFIVSVIVPLIEMVTTSENGVLGCIMNIISTCSFACTASVIYKKKRTLLGAVTGLVTSSLMMVLVMLLWNYLITPIYMGYPREAVVELLVPAFLPFNLLKAGLNAGFTFLLYKPITTALRKAGYISDSQNVQGWKPIGLWPFSGILVITCILLILSFNGII